MYYPLQIPSILDKDFMEQVEYKEYHNPFLDNYVMCIWSMHSYHYLQNTINNTILPDGCIDLIIDFSKQEIYFTGNSKATLNYPLSGNVDFMGIRIKPGVFYNVYKIDCSKAMDDCIPYDQIEKNHPLNEIFNLQSCKDRVGFLNYYFKEKVIKLETDLFIEAINKFYQKEDIKFVSELANYFGYSERQLNRLFKQHCGVSMKVFLNIIRLHNSLKLLLNSNNTRLIDLAIESGFYDESHFVKEIKKYCGISPTDLMKRYNMS